MCPLLIELHTAAFSSNSDDNNDVDVRRSNFLPFLIFILQTHIIMSQSARQHLDSFKWVSYVPSNPKVSHFEQLQQRFTNALPELYRYIALERSGETPVNAIVECVNVATKKPMRSNLSIFYHVDNDITDEELRLLLVEYVSESFQNELESSGSAATSNGDLNQASSSTTTTSSAASFSSTSSSSASDTSKSSLRFCAIAEDNHGYIFALDTTTGVVVLIDPAHHRGPWIAAQSFNEFCEHLEETKECELGETEEDVDADEDEDEDDLVDYDGNNADFDDDENEYCCNVCMDPIEVVRYHCEVCVDFDICESCYNQKKVTGTHENSHPMVATMN